MKPIQLRAPDGTDIVGMLAKDGTVFGFTCKHHLQAGFHNFFYGLPADKLGSAADRDGDVVLVDANGKQWRGLDVQQASTPRA